MTSQAPKLNLADYQDAGWRAGVFRMLTIATLSGGFATGPIALIRAVGGPDMIYVALLSFAAGIAAVLTTTTLAQPDRRGQRGAVVRLGELVLLLLIVRLVVWTVRGFPQPAEIGRWVQSPGLFFGGEYVAAGVVTALGWLVALVTAIDFYDLAIRPDEVAARESRSWGDGMSQLRAYRPVDRQAVLAGFVRRWLSSGMVLVLFVAALRVGIEEHERKLIRLVLRDAGLPLSILIGVLAYFLAGLLLMSHGRLAVLRARWYNDGVVVAPQLARRWHLVTVVGLFVVAGLSLLLPLGTTSGLSQVLNQALAWVWRAALYLIGLMHLLITFLLRWLPGSAGAQQNAPAEQLPVPPVVPTQRDMMMQLPPWLGGALLWLVVGLIGGYLLLRFLRVSGFFDTRAGKRWLHLRFWWRARTRAVARTYAVQLSRLRRRLRRARQAGARPAPVVSHNPATPRDRVRAYYLSTVREASDKGVVRQPHETPLEYARDLRAGWPEAGPDVEALTDAFLEARYTRDEIDADKGNAVEALWRRVQRTFARRP